MSTTTARSRARSRAVGFLFCLFSRTYGVYMSTYTPTYTYNATHGAHARGDGQIAGGWFFVLFV